MKVFEGWLDFARKGLGVLHQHPKAPKTCARFMRAYINLLRPNISVHIPNAVFHTFLKVLTRRICLTIKNFFTW